MKFFAASALVVLSPFFIANTSFAKDKKTIKKLKKDISYLASDELEGRRTGTPGEKKAAEYIINYYTQNGISAYKGNYRYPFNFVSGKEIMPLTNILINGKKVTNLEEVFPLPFSVNSKRASGEALPGVLEHGNVWLMPLYADADEAKDAHFDWEKVAYEKAKEAAKQGAAAVLFYDNFGAKFTPEFNKKSDYEAIDIPVAMLTNKGYKKYMESHEGNVAVDIMVILKKAEMTGTNLAAYIDNGAKNTVVLGAHYDHLGHGEDGNSLHAKKDGQIHNGADDNASGTVALMHLATKIKNSKLKQYNYMFIHFSGEELGLLGSKAIVKEEKLDSTKIAYMINMDMVGRLNDSTHALTVGGIGTSPVWGKMIDKNNPSFKITYDSAGVGPSDHSSFYYQNVPVLFFFTGLHTDYHKPSDDADKINYKGQAILQNYIYDVVSRMEKEPKPAFTPTKQTTVGKVRFKVTLGVMPDYSYQDGGVRIDGVTDNKPAQKAGMKGGDIIIQLGEHKITGMQTYMEALGKFAEGDKTQVKVLREGKEVILPIEFTGNK
ncbi:MAG: M20/M25/M40 family metallo-hydrolase [Flavipsychrobacter sp.]|nr:M20/M25/M40 family metallo-hydrolase [Flavipsychrobacter sp.]